MRASNARRPDNGELLVSICLLSGKALCFSLTIRHLQLRWNLASLRLRRGKHIEKSSVSPNVQSHNYSLFLRSGGGVRAYWPTPPASLEVEHTAGRFSPCSAALIQTGVKQTWSQRGCQLGGYLCKAHGWGRAGGCSLCTPGGVCLTHCPIYCVGRGVDKPMDTGSVWCQHECMLGCVYMSRHTHNAQIIETFCFL